MKVSVNAAQTAMSSAPLLMAQRLWMLCSALSLSYACPLGSFTPSGEAEQFLNVGNASTMSFQHDAALPSPSLLRPRGINSPQERKAAKREKARGACFWQNQPEREREGQGLWLTPHLCLEATQSGHCCAASCPQLALVQGLCSGLELPYAASFGRRWDLVMLLLPTTTDS